MESARRVTLAPCWTRENPRLIFSSIQASRKGDQNVHGTSSRVCEELGARGGSVEDEMTVAEDEKVRGAAQEGGRPEQAEVHSGVAHQQPLPIVEAVSNGAGQVHGPEVVDVAIEVHLGLIYHYRKHEEELRLHRARCRQPDGHLQCFA
eukprot:3761873-Rhodomonas_salina.1